MAGEMDGCVDKLHAAHVAYPQLVLNRKICWLFQFFIFKFVQKNKEVMQIPSLSLQ